MQRLLDVLFAGLALLALSPLLAPLIVALRLTGEGEVFFTQTRIGREGETFGLLKFATMLKNSPNMGTGTVTVKDDPRILPFGGLLRRTKINELPQLWNVVRGDMSLIGPRPLTRQTFDAYTPEVQAIVTRVRPGLSGLASVVLRGEEDLLPQENAMAFYASVIAPYKGELERWYVAHQGVGTYLLLILATVAAVALPRAGAIWRLFPALPAPPERLREALAYPR
jgi:lipopolysaccharide/colanic/teichoic acid biosynthesis glycosyltransferase